MQLESRENDVLPQGYNLLWYDFINTIGRGGYGVTYLCLDKNLHRKVAIKEYLPREFACREADDTVNPLTKGHNELFTWGLERFLIEARTLAKFNHPNIIKVLSVFEQNNTAYMVMEYEEGNNLAEIYENNPHYSETELLKIFIPIVEGLALVHKEGFIHRDIKPSNIYIRNDGTSVLLDFGSARQTLGSRTRALTSLVTSGYAPFEQYNQSEDGQGAWTDVYALGATLHYCVTGQKPTDALERGSSLLKSQQDNYSPLAASKYTEFSEQFLAAINNALMFHSDSRPQDAQQWLDMLKGNIKVKHHSGSLESETPNRGQNFASVDEGIHDVSYMSNASQTPEDLVIGAGNYIESDCLEEATIIQPRAARVIVDTAKNTNKIDNFIESSKKLFNQFIGWSQQSLAPVISIINKNRKVAATSGGIFTVIIVSVIINLSSENEEPVKLTTEKMISENTVSENEKAEEDVEVITVYRPQPIAYDPETNLEALQNAQINKLLAKVKFDLENEHYIEPVNNNTVLRIAEILEMQPDQPEALEYQNTVVTHLIQSTEKHITDKNYTQALSSINTLSVISPNDAVIEELKINLGERKAQSASVDKWLRKAKRAFDRKYWTRPKANNALEYYQRVLHQEPDNLEAISGVNNIVVVLSELLDKQIKNKRFSNAVKTRNKIATIDANAPILAESEPLINAYYEKRKQINKLLAAAKNDFIQGRLVSPKGNNALAKYRKVKRMSRNNKKAKEGIEMIYGYYVSSVYQYIDQSRFKEAKKALRTLKSIGYGKKQIASLNNIIDDKISNSK